LQRAVVGIVAGRPTAVDVILNGRAGTPMRGGNRHAPRRCPLPDSVDGRSPPIPANIMQMVQQSGEGTVKPAFPEVRTLD
jgi:hypothetical protein